MSLSISWQFSKHQLSIIFQIFLLICTILLSILGARIKWKIDITSMQDIFIQDLFVITHFFFQGVTSWVYFLPLLFTLLFPIISYCNRKAKNSKKPISPNDYKLTTIVIITGFLYAIPITVAYLENNCFIDVLNSYQYFDLYHYVPEVFIPVTAMVLSIEWKNKVAPAQ
ncbi:unnamed protein product [Caenorhabditis nigoni]